MGWLVSVLGVLLIVAALWDVFLTLWYPSGRGRLAHTVMATVWRVTHHLGDRARQVSGPLAMVGVIASWATLMVLGGALLYLPHLPEAFTYSPGLSPHEGSTFVDALYLSIVTVATLGYGDIVPTIAWLRLATPLQALTGFALLTAAVSWGMQVYPALSRRRKLSLRLTALRKAGAQDALDQLSGATAARMLDALGNEIAQVRVDLTQYSETFYFHEASPDATFALTVGYAHDLAQAGRRCTSPDTRLTATTLLHSLDDLAHLLAEQYLGERADTSAVLEAYAAEQRSRR